MERYDKALEDLDQAIELAPKKDRNHYQRGITLGEMERYDDALRAFDQAIELAPDKDWLHYQRAATLRQMGRCDEALQSIELALAYNAHDVESLWLQAILLTLLNCPQDAEGAFETCLNVAIENDDFDSSGLANMIGEAILHTRLGMQDKANDLLTQALERAKQSNRDDSDIYQNLEALSICHLLRSEGDEALICCERAMDLGPSRSQLLTTLEQIEDIDIVLPGLKNISEIGQCLNRNLKSRSKQGATP